MLIKVKESTPLEPGRKVVFWKVINGEIELIEAEVVRDHLTYVELVINLDEIIEMPKVYLMQESAGHRMVPYVPYKHKNPSRKRSRA